MSNNLLFLLLGILAILVLGGLFASSAKKGQPTKLSLLGLGSVEANTTNALNA